jgi:hypothetical protein
VDFAASTGSAGMAVDSCIFSDNSPPGRSIVRRQSESVARFTVVNCVFSDSIPSESHASGSGNTVGVTASHRVRTNGDSHCAGSCPTTRPLFLPSSVFEFSPLIPRWRSPNLPLQIPYRWQRPRGHPQAVDRK